MQNIKALFREEKINKTIENLKNKGFDVVLVNNVEEAEKLTLQEIPRGSSISMGGSVTLNMTGLLQKFRSEEYSFFERFAQPTWEDTVKVMRESLLSDYLVTGTNAITEDGKLLQVDSGGNRVAGMAYGPKNVIVISGINKIVADTHEGLERLKYAGPLNSKRLNHKKPCNISGKCENCSTHRRMCNFISIISNVKKPFGNVKVILIKEELGY